MLSTKLIHQLTEWMDKRKKAPQWIPKLHGKSTRVKSKKSNGSTLKPNREEEASGSSSLVAAAGKRFSSIL